MNDVTVTVVGREGCHLCDEAESVIKEVLKDFTNTRFEHTTLDKDPQWAHDYGDKIPVVLINGDEHCYWRVNPERLRTVLVELGAISE